MLGYSGGGPFALACAAALPEQVIRAAAVCSDGPLEIPGHRDGIHPNNLQFLEMARDKPLLGRLMLRVMGLLVRFFPAKMIENALNSLPEPDRQVIAPVEMQQGFLNMIRAALRQGPRGAQQDTALMVSPWGIA